MKKSIFIVSMIILLIVFVFCNCILLSKKYASTGMSWYKHYIRIDFEKYQENKVECLLYDGENKIVESNNQYVDILKKVKGNPFELTFLTSSLYNSEILRNEDGSIIINEETNEPMTRDVILLKVFITRDDGNIIEKNIEISLSKYNENSKSGYTINCDTGEMTETNEKINKADIAVSLSEEIENIMKIIRNITGILMLILICAFIILKIRKN